MTTQPVKIIRIKTGFKIKTRYFKTFLEAWHVALKLAYWIKPL